MDYTITSSNPEKQRTDCLIIGVYHKSKLTPTAHYLNKCMKGFINSVLKQGDLTETLGETLLIIQPPQLLAKRLLIVNCGAEKEILDEGQYQKILRNAATRLKQTQAKTAHFYLTELPVKKHPLAWKTQRAVISCADSLYQFTQLKSTTKQPLKLKEISFNVVSRKHIEPASQAIAQGIAIAEGVAFSKELSNLPANICTPTYLAKQAQALTKTSRKLTCQILDEPAMKKLKMGALLSVTQGSDQPAKFIILQYKGGKASQAPIVLVGKGITFDSGGISLKPSAKMDEMKFDMVGAASMLGTMKTVTMMKHDYHHYSAGRQRDTTAYRR